MGHPPRLLTVGLILSLLILWTPESRARGICTTGCHGMQTNGAYKEGQTYTYEFEGTSTTSVTEGQGEATMKIKAEVELVVKPDCIRQLRLKNVQVDGAPVAQKDVEQYAMQFNYHNGHIDAELCAEPSDTQASMNLKRAVISLFQSAVMQDEGSTTRHEIDVFGGCITDFTFRKDGETLIVHKTRDLRHCSHRENIRDGLYSGLVNPGAGIHSFPLIGAHQKIEQRFKSGVLDKAVSTETYNLKPFSNGDAGAKTVVEAILTFKGQKGDSPAAPVSKSKSIIFEAPHTTIKATADDIAKAVKAVHDEKTENAKDSAAMFTDLIKLLRKSSKNDIMTVYGKIKSGAGFDKERDKKVLLDALYRTATGEAAEVMVELIKSKDVTPLQEMLYYASLAYVQHVNRPSVTAVSALLDMPELPRTGYLGVGQVIGKYCQEHPCENVAEVKDAIGKFGVKIGDGKSKTRAQEDVIIAALKGLGNVKYMDDETLKKIANIAADKKVRNRVRVAALEALPTKCSKVWQNVLFKVLADRDEDSEVRIKTYLSLVACPSPSVANHLKEVLDKETIYQVGSFITSHLRNLRASVDPFKQEAKAQLGLLKPKTKFPEDIRKYSFNNELSYTIDAFGFGSTVESNVIYSQNSFVPRSVGLNMTGEIFGHTFNFLELNGRAENLDRVIEHFFGPKGVFNNKKPEDVAEGSAKSLKELGKYIKERYDKTTRGKREVKQTDLDKFSKKVHLRGNEVDEDLDLDLSLKLFGVELAFLSYESTKYTPQQVVDRIFSYLDLGIDKLKNLDFKTDNHIHFLDGDLTYPTGIGAGLELSIHGSAVVHMKTNAKIDIPAILADPKNAAIKLGVEPTINVEVMGQFGVVDGFGAESKIEVFMVMHSSTGYDLNVQVLDGKGIDITLGLPKKKQEIISVSSNVNYSKGKTFTPMKFGKGIERSECLDQFTAPLGITVCGHLKYPYDSLAAAQKKPMFPLNGPAKLELTVENNDVSSYHFKALYNTKNPKMRSFEVLLETPNSKTKRYVSFTVEGTIDPEPRAKIAFDSPIKKLAAEVAVKKSAEEKTLTVTVTHDEMEYFARAGVKSIGGNKYKPILEYKIPEHIEKLTSKGNSKAVQKGGQMHEVQGTIEVAEQDGGKKFTFDKVQFVSSGQKIIGIDGSASCTPTTVKVDLSVSHINDKVDVKLDGKRMSDTQFSLSGSVLPSKHPQNGLSLEWDFNRQRSNFEQKIALTHGPDFKSETNRLTFTQKSEYNFDRENFALSTHNKITYPNLGLVIKAEGALTKKSLKSELEFKYARFKAGAKLEAEVNKEKPGDYDVEMDVEFQGNKLELDAKRTILSDIKSKFENSLKMTPGGTYQADATISYHVKPNDINVQIESDVNLKGIKVKATTGLEANPEKINSHAQITANSVKYLDYVLKIQRGASPSGNLVLNLKNYLKTNGQFNYANGKGSGQITINIPKISRTITGSGDYSLTGTKHVAHAELLYDAENDPNKKVKFSTNTDIGNGAVDMKNILEILTYKTEMNLKGKLKGDFNNGHLVGDLDLLLPNARYIVFKIDRQVTKKDDGLDAVGKIELEDHVTKGGQVRKLTIDANGNVFSRKGKTFQIAHIIKFVNFDGKDISTKINVKNVVVPNTDKKSAEVEISTLGSMITHTPSIHGAAEYDPHSVAFKGSISCKSDFVIKANGNYGRGNDVDKPHTLKGSIEAKLPNDKLKNIKIDFDEDVLYQKQTGGLFQYNILNSLTYNDDKKIKLEAHYKRDGLEDIEDLSKYVASFTATLAVLDKPPLTFSDVYQHDMTGDVKKFHQTYKLKYGEKEGNSDVDVELHPQLNKVIVKGKINTPFQKYHDIDFQLDHVKESEESRKTDILLTVDGEKYSQTTEIHLGDSPGIHFVFTCPQGKTELLSRFVKLHQNEYTGEYKLITPKGFVTADGRVKLDSVDDFNIHFNFDSDKFKYRKIHGEIANKPSDKDGRRIFITVTSDGKNLVTGSTNYKRHQEGNKITIEGNGSLNVGESTKTSSFKYTRKQLTAEDDKEVGVAIMLNASFGPSAVVGELKLSSKEVHVFHSYCEQSKDCAHFKLQSTLDTDRATRLNHQLQVEVNLKKFNVPAEFGLMASTKYADLSFDHQANLYLHSSKDRTQYTYHVYSNQKESAAILTLPSREMAVIALHDIPAVKHSGTYKIDISLYLDRKNKPTEKTSLIFDGDVNTNKNVVSLNGEGKFIYPSQPKDMAIRGKLLVGGENWLDANVDLDVFAKKAQMISASAVVRRFEVPKGYNVSYAIELKSKGQQLKVDFQEYAVLTSSEIAYGWILNYNDEHQKPKTVGVTFNANVEEINFVVQTPSKDLIKSHSKMVLSSNSQKIDTEFSMMGNKPVIITIEAKDLNSFKYLAHLKDSPNTKFLINGRVVLGQLAEVHADDYVDGTKHDLFHFLVHLDESQFLKPDFAHNKENIVALLKRVQERYAAYAVQFKDAVKEFNTEVSTELNDFFSHLKKAQPNLKPLISYYQTELTKLKEELHADATIKEIQAVLNKVFGGVIATMVEIMKQLAEHFDELHVQLNDLYTKLAQAVKSTYPQLKESFDKILEAAVQVSQSILKTFTVYFEAVLNVINAHQKDFKELATVISELGQDVGKILFKAVTQIEKEVKDFVHLLVEQLKALPVYEMAKKAVQDVMNYKVPNYILRTIDELNHNIMNILPTQELKELYKAIHNYIMKHVKHEKIDDVNEIKKIYANTFIAIRSVISLLQSRVTVENIFGFVETQIPVDIAYLKKLPGLSTMRLSVLKLLFGGELPKVLELYYVYRPHEDLLDSIPPASKNGYFMDGGHMFTFDGRHITLTGSCNYILAQDMLDGNFSVVADYNNGKLASVTLTEKNGESITLKANGHILVNNKPAEFPASTKNIDAFLTPPFARLMSKYGVRISCDTAERMMCYVKLSGYYHGRVRGLLGDANNEPYDDFILPTGKVTENAADFGNAYKLASSCPAATAKELSDSPRAPICTKYFAGKSTMSSCFNYVSPTTFRTACDHAVAAGTIKGACGIATAYATECFYSGIRIEIPADCGTCHVGTSDIAVGDSFSVKIPKKEADIIFVVEQETENEKAFHELVLPMITELRTELKQHGITDVYVGMIGFSEYMEWPRHYTSRGNLNIEGEVKNMKFTPREPIITTEAARDGNQEMKMKYIWQRIDVELGTFKLTDAYEAAIRYPFRPGAAKAVVGLISLPCEKSPFGIFSLQMLRLLMGLEVYKELGLTYYHMSPMTDIEVGGKPQKNIVGYDSESVYTLTDSKKKPLEGNTKMRSSLVQTSGDVCANFAVQAGGAAFSTHNFMESKPNQKKQYIQVAARRIADNLAAMELEEDCTCVFKHGINARPSCKIVNRKEKAPIVRLTRHIAG